MLAQALLLVCAALPLAQAETVLGLYIFHRHGDRTAKATPPANLTDFGYQEVFTSGTWFREQYISSSAASRISGIEPDLVKLGQLSASAPLDNVLQSSAIGFLSALYPPVGAGMDTETLRNGTVVTAPLNGFQLIPVEIATSGGNSEDSAWLQGASGCGAATTSSNEYFYTPDYMERLSGTMDFYQGLLPMINGTFNTTTATYKNAYTIFDLLNVASIHNATNFNASSLLTPTTLSQLRTLADHHEWNLAYNASTPVRAIQGATLAAQILQALNATVTSTKSSPKLNIQFGAYGSFTSFFGLAGLLPVSPDFYGVADYASAMVFELVTNSTTTPTTALAPEDLAVRFRFHNGTTSNASTPAAYPLFGQPATVLPWADFASNMSRFAVGSQAQWCVACGNTTGVCAGSVGGADNSTSSGLGAGGDGQDTGAAPASGGMSNAVAGVVGAMVTLAVVLLLEGLVLVLGGLRLVSKKRLVAASSPAASAVGGKA
ncbi:hypothetical protein MMC34_000841 [Xylographa carneopallida]|nr:hypothetical protein [Xylographa carneopallida]